MSTEPTNLKILAKMALVANEDSVQYIVKDAKNEHFKFNYASEKAIKEAVYPALRKHGVLFQLNQGVPFLLGSNLIVPCEYHFWDIEAGEALSGTFNGEGMDSQGKGVYIATTGAIKYLMTSIFGIVTGSASADPDHDRNNPSQQTDHSMPPDRDEQVPTPPPPKPQSGEKIYTMESKYGSNDKPNKCGHCGAFHIIIGDSICKDPETGKYGAEKCYWDKQK